MEKILLVEVTEKEMSLIMKERARAEKQRKREAYVHELNELIQRAKADGFTIAANHTFKACGTVSYAMCWSDAAGNYIGLG